MSAPDQSEPPTPPMGFPQPKARRHGWAVALGTVIGLVVGGGGVGLAWALTAGSGSRGAAADAAAACTAIRDADTPTIENLELPNARRWGAAAELAIVAGDADQRFTELGDAFDKIQRSIMVFDLTSADFQEAIATVRASCD